MLTVLEKSFIKSDNLVKKIPKLCTGVVQSHNKLKP